MPVAQVHMNLPVCSVVLYVLEILVLLVHPEKVYQFVFCELDDPRRLQVYLLLLQYVDQLHLFLDERQQISLLLFELLILLQKLSHGPVLATVFLRRVVLRRLLNLRKPVAGVSHTAAASPGR